MMPKVLKNFENDARTQVQFHLMAAWFWFMTMFFTPVLFPPKNKQDLVQMLILLVSLYANFATEYGSVAAAQASLKSDGVQ